MNLREIVARLKLKYKIVKGTVYSIIEEDEYSDSTMRPATRDEIEKIQKREEQKKLKEILKKYGKGIKTTKT